MAIVVYVCRWPPEPLAEAVALRGAGAVILDPGGYRAGEKLDADAVVLLGDIPAEIEQQIRRDYGKRVEERLKDSPVQPLPVEPMTKPPQVVKTKGRKNG